MIRELGSSLAVVGQGSGIKWLMTIGSLALAVVGISLRLGLHLLFLRSETLRAELAWQDRGPTPDWQESTTPQGLTWVKGRLILANTWKEGWFRKDVKSHVYEIDVDGMEIRRSFVMPPEARHTSGLAARDGLLWAVDYRSNRAYCLELEASFQDGAAKVLGSFATTLKGTSACCWVRWQGESLLAISDFMNSRRTIFVRPSQAMAEGTAEAAIVFEYRNQGFSQGLIFINGYLYEAENKWGKDVINKIDLDLIERFRSSREATVCQYTAPSRGVEDLAWDGKLLWTSDETVFRIFSSLLQ